MHRGGEKMSDVHSCFKLKDNGGIHITLDDPTFVRAETVLVNVKSGEVKALLQQKLHSLGIAPANIILALKSRDDVTLHATRIDGSCLELRSHVVLTH
jgi:hypothetical protein